MRTVGVNERRARLALRHHLTTQARTDDAVQIACDMLGLHATDPATVYLAAVARMATPDIDTVDRALYDHRSVVRMLGMRRTMFVVPAPLAPVVHEACTRDIAARERKRTVKFLDQSHIAEITDDCAAWLRHVEQDTLAALEARGAALPAELAEDVPQLREQIEVGKDTKWPAKLGLSSRVLFQLAADGHIVRGRPRGSWISTQYRWSPMGAWLDDAPPSMPAEAARVDLARRWLRAFGPGTAGDLKWWTGWTVTQTRKVLAEIGPVEVDLGGATGLLLDDDVAPVPAVEPWAALLPALDPTVMGWTERDWYLGAHRPALFDRNGNAGPTIWWDGRIVGGWAQRRDGEIVTRLLEEARADARAAIAAEVERLRSWLGDKRFIPKFRTPLERELSA
jgi:hypothetical protein